MSEWTMPSDEQNLDAIFEQFGKMDILARAGSMIRLVSYIRDSDFLSDLRRDLELSAKGLKAGIINPAAMYYCILQVENAKKAFDAMLRAKITEQDLEWRDHVNPSSEKDDRKIEDLIRGVDDDSDDE